MTHHFVMTSSLRVKIIKIDKFGDFSCDNDCSSSPTYLEMLFPLFFSMRPQAQRAPPAGIKCPPPAQRKQAKRGVFIHAGSTFRCSILCRKLFSANHVLVQKSLTPSLIHFLIFRLPALYTEGYGEWQFN